MTLLNTGVQVFPAPEERRKLLRQIHHSLNAAVKENYEEEDLFSLAYNPDPEFLHDETNRYLQWQANQKAYYQEHYEQEYAGRIPGSGKLLYLLLDTSGTPEGEEKNRKLLDAVSSREINGQVSEGYYDMIRSAAAFLLSADQSIFINVESLNTQKELVRFCNTNRLVFGIADALDDILSDPAAKTALGDSVYQLLENRKSFYQNSRRYRELLDAMQEKGAWLYEAMAPEDAGRLAVNADHLQQEGSTGSSSQGNEEDNLWEIQRYGRHVQQIRNQLLYSIPSKEQTEELKKNGKLNSSLRARNSNGTPADYLKALSDRSHTITFTSGKPEEQQAAEEMKYFSFFQAAEHLRVLTEYRNFFEFPGEKGHQEVLKKSMNQLSEEFQQLKSARTGSDRRSGGRLAEAEAEFEYSLKALTDFVGRQVQMTRELLQIYSIHLKHAMDAAAVYTGSLPQDIRNDRRKAFADRFRMQCATEQELCRQKMVECGILPADQQDRKVAVQPQAAPVPNPAEDLHTADMTPEESHRAAVTIFEGNHEPLSGTAASIDLLSFNDMQRFCVADDTTGEITTPFYTPEAAQNYDILKNPAPHLGLLQQNFNMDLLLNKKIFCYAPGALMPLRLTIEKTGHGYTVHMTDQLDESLPMTYTHMFQQRQDLRRQQIINEVKIHDVQRIAAAPEHMMGIYREFYAPDRPTKEQADSRTVKSFAEVSLYNGKGKTDNSIQLPKDLQSPLSNDEFTILTIAALLTADVNPEDPNPVPMQIHKLSMSTDTLAYYRRAGYGEHNIHNNARRIVVDAVVKMADGDFEPAGKVLAEGLNHLAYAVRETNVDINGHFNNTAIANMVPVQKLLEMLEDPKHQKLKEAAEKNGLKPENLQMLKAKRCVWQLERQNLSRMENLLQNRIADTETAESQLEDLLAAEILRNSYTRLTAELGEMAKNKAEEIYKPRLDNPALTMLEKTNLQIESQNVGVAEGSMKIPVSEFEKRLAVPGEAEKLIANIKSSPRFQLAMEQVRKEIQTPADIGRYLNEDKHLAFEKNCSFTLDDMLYIPEHHPAVDEKLLSPEYKEMITGLSYGDYARHPEKLPEITPEAEITKSMEKTANMLLNIHYQKAMRRLNLVPSSDLLNMMDRCTSFEEAKAQYLSDPKRFYRGPDPMVLQDHLAEMYDAVKRDNEYRQYGDHYLHVMFKAYKYPELSKQTRKNFEDAIAAEKPDPKLRSSKEIQTYDKNLEAIKDTMADHVIVQSLEKAYGMPRWALRMLNKPGMTEEEKQEIRSLNDGTRKGYARLAIRYLKALSDVGEREFIEDDWEEYHGENRAEHRYCGILAWDSTLMLEDMKQYGVNIPKEVRDNIIAYTNAASGNYCKLDYKDEMLLNPLAKYMKAENAFTDESKTEYIDLMQKKCGIDENDQLLSKGMTGGILKQTDQKPVIAGTPEANKLIQNFKTAADLLTKSLEAFVALQSKAADPAPEEKKAEQPADKTVLEDKKAEQPGDKPAQEEKKAEQPADIPVQEEKKEENAGVKPADQIPVNEIKEAAAEEKQEEIHTDVIKEVEKPAGGMKEIDVDLSDSRNQKDSSLEASGRNTDEILQTNEKQGKEEALPEPEAPAVLKNSHSSLPDYEQWFRSLEWQLRSRGVSTAYTGFAMNEGKIRLLQRKNPQAKNFMTADEAEKMNLYQMAKGQGIYVETADGSKPLFITADEDQKTAVIQKNQLNLGKETDISNTKKNPMPVYSLSEKEKTRYRDEMIRLAGELHKTDSRFSKDSAAYRNLRAELTYCTETLNGAKTFTAENLQERTKVVAQYCIQYMNDHKGKQVLSERQVRRLKVMNRLMDLNYFCHGASLKNPEGKTVLNETQQMVALKIIQNRALYLQANPNEAGLLKLPENKDFFGRGCLLNHDTAWKEAETLSNTISFKAFVNSERFPADTVLKTDGQKVFRTYAKYAESVKDLNEKMRNRQSNFMEDAKELAAGKKMNRNSAGSMEEDNIRADQLEQVPEKEEILF